MVSIISNLEPILLAVERLILGLLVLLGIASIGIFVWRLRSYSAARGDGGKWMKLLTANLASPSHAGLTAAGADEGTLPGRIVKAGVDNMGLAPEALEKVLEVQESAERRELDKGLSFLGTVGSNAPFLGLTGTVIGILVAFDRFAATGGKGSTEVMIAISRALIATAVGLMVAIPAVVFYNILRNKVKGMLDEAREIRGLLLARSLHASALAEGTGVSRQAGAAGGAGMTGGSSGAGAASAGGPGASLSGGR